ncbi:MAG TPA: endo-1,4-beta-xylanase, partial [Puia sp.]
MIHKTFLLFATLAIGLYGSAQDHASQGPAQSPTLKGAFRNDFLIGAAINTRQIEEKDPAAAKLIPEQFSALTPENIMKAEIIHPAWDKYNFDLADKLVAYAQRNNIKVNAHNLIWHSQLPGYVRRIKNAD